VSVPEWGPGRIVCGRYTVQSVLARTPLTRTYAALTEPNREVVLRVFGPEAGPSLDALAQRMPLLSSLPQPAVVRILEITVDPSSGARFIATERCRHPSLATLVELCPLAPAEGLAFATKLASALDAAHSRGIAHLGLRPANVFVGPMPQSTVQVADFAVPRLGPVTFDQARWLSPEQLLERPPTPASDVLSAALIVFHALTGKAYWAATTIEELAREHNAPRKRASQRAAELGVTLPDSMDGAFEAALALDPGVRPKLTSDFARALAGPAALSPTDIAPPPLEAFSSLQAIEAQRVFNVEPAPTPTPAPPSTPAPTPTPISPNSGTTWPQAFEPLPPPPAYAAAPAPAAPFDAPPISRRRRPNPLTIGLSVVAGLLFLSAAVILIVAVTKKKPTEVAKTTPVPSASVAAISSPPPSVIPAPPPLPQLPTATTTAVAVDPPDAAVASPPDAVDPKMSELVVVCQPVPCKVVLIDRKPDTDFPDATKLPPGQHGVGVNGEGYWGDWKLVTTKAGEQTTVTFDLKPRPPGSPEPTTTVKKPCGKFLDPCPK
jgi:eukaryotic-like serine/threonine-protein kinase